MSDIFHRAHAATLDRLRANGGRPIVLRAETGTGFTVTMTPTGSRDVRLDIDGPGLKTTRTTWYGGEPGSVFGEAVAVGPGQRAPVAQFSDFLQALPDRLRYVLQFPGGATVQFLLHRE